MKTYSVDMIIETRITIDFESQETNPSKILHDAYSLILENRKKEDLFNKKDLSFARIRENEKIIKTYFEISEVENEK